MTSGSRSGVPTLFDALSQCCGCTACMMICPQDAIAVQPDSEGFDYPMIDASLCIGCQLCVRVCPMRAKDARSSASDQRAKEADE